MSVLRWLTFVAFVIVIICVGRGIAVAREDGACFAGMAPGSEALFQAT